MKPAKSFRTNISRTGLAECGNLIDASGSSRNEIGKAPRASFFIVKVAPHVF
jgi:hypothetical protein